MSERTNENNRLPDIEEAPKQAAQTESTDLSGEGCLSVRVYTAAGAIPLEGAIVIIRDSPSAGGGIVV